MKNFSKIFFLIISLVILSSPSSSNSQSAQATQQGNIIAEMQRRESILRGQIDNTTDKKKRYELYMKRKQIQDMYADGDIRKEAIRQTNPGLAAALDAQESYTVATVDQQQGMKGWEGLPATEKQAICAQLHGQCVNAKEIEFCRFVVVRCRGYIDDAQYQALVESYQSRKAN